MFAHLGRVVVACLGSVVVACLRSALVVQLGSVKVARRICVVVPCLDYTEVAHSG